MTLSSTPGQKPGASIPLRREEAMLPLTEQRNHSCVLRREQLECPFSIRRILIHPIHFYKNDVLQIKVAHSLGEAAKCQLKTKMI